MCCQLYIYKSNFTFLFCFVLSKTFFFSFSNRIGVYMQHQYEVICMCSFKPCILEIMFTATAYSIVGEIIQHTILFSVSIRKICYCYVILLSLIDLILNIFLQENLHSIIKLLVVMFRQHLVKVEE